MIDYTRQRDIFNPATTRAAATIIGCGGIGSFTAFALAKLGVGQLTLVDFDTVDAHNVPNQLYAPEDIGRNKVDALADTLRCATGAEVRADAYPLAEGIPRSPVVVSALDSMSARAALWEQVKNKLDVGLFLDGRIGGEHVVLYSLSPTQPDAIAGYEASLHSDADGLELPCTGRAIIDVGFAIASLITRRVRGFYAREELAPVAYLNQRTLELHTGGWFNG